MPIFRVINTLCLKLQLTISLLQSRLDPRRVQQHSFLEIDHEIFFTVIPSLPLIQEGQLSISDEGMCSSTAKRTKPAQEKVWLGEPYCAGHGPNGLTWP